MARRLGTKLVLVHVDEVRGLAALDPTLVEVALSQGRSALGDEVARLRGLGTVVEGKLLSGSAFDEVVTAAVESKGRLLVVGAVGHGISRRLLVGSVAERAAETSPVPTLVMRPGSRFGSWLRGEHALKILVGYDFSEASDAALHWVNEMQNAGACEVTVAHVDWPPDQAHRVGYHGPLPLTENPGQIQKILEGDLAKRVEKFLPLDKVTIVVKPGWGHPEGSLFELASGLQSDLVVVGTNRRQGLARLQFGSVSRGVLRHATGSVAVVPPPEERKRA